MCIYVRIIGTYVYIRRTYIYTQLSVLLLPRCKQVQVMPVLSLYARERIRVLMSQGSNVRDTMKALEREGIETCRQTVWRFWVHYKTYRSIEPLPRPGRSTKLTETVQNIIEVAINENDETTAKELASILVQQGYQLSRRTILRGRKSLGWTSRGAAYCQLIRTQNKDKRLQWAREHLDDEFTDVVWTDETTVQLEAHRRFCCRKKGQKPRYKPRPKHPVKVHVWAGISHRGSTRICIFEGIMNADLYVQILEECLVPFVRETYPDGHRFMQDNDPKHTSRQAQNFFTQHTINWWKTPAESPDANPIENLWHELKVNIFVFSLLVFSTQILSIGFEFSYLCLYRNLYDVK